VAAEAARRQGEAEQRRRYEIERRMRPRTTADFEILYNELEAWRLQVRNMSERKRDRQTVRGVAKSQQRWALIAP